MMSGRGWRRQAACRGSGPALFFDPHPASTTAAKQVCAACPVRRRCAEHAEAAGEQYGVWGGLAPGERPVAPPRIRPGRGPVAQLGDDDLYDLFADADPDRPALDQLLEHVYLPTATAYKYLARAERLGVVEHRGRGLYPLRR